MCRVDGAQTVKHRACLTLGPLQLAVPDWGRGDAVAGRAGPESVRTSFLPTTDPGGKSQIVPESG